MITITGATGKTGNAAATALLEQGVAIRAIGRSHDRLEQLHFKGAEVAIGDQGDAAFLTRAFTGSSAVYLLIPPKIDAEDFRTYYNLLGEAAITAIKRSGVEKVVFLSSLGAELSAGTGPVVGLHDVEQKLKTLKNVDIVLLRPGYFMENSMGTISLIHGKNSNGGSMPPDALINLVAATDIGRKAAELLKSHSFTGHTIVELVGDRISYAEMTAIIGRSLGMPELPYIQFSDEASEELFMGMGFSKSVAHSYTELTHAVAEGRIGTTMIDRDTFTAPTRFTEFVEEVFKPAFMNYEQHSMA